MNFNVGSSFGGQPFSRNHLSDSFKNGPIKSILSSNTGPKNHKRSVMLNTPSKGGLTLSLSPMKSGSITSRLNKETFSS